MDEEHPIEKLYKKYGHRYSMLLKYKFDEDPTAILLFYRRNGDYLIATTEGDEYVLKLETLDKVRDICSGNIRSLDDHEFEVLQKFSDSSLLEHMSEESMKRFFENETGHKVTDYDLLISNCIFEILVSPESFVIDFSRNEEDNLRSAEKRIKDLLGVDVKLDSTFDMLTKTMIKMSSDLTFEREEFLRRIRHKKSRERRR